MIVRKVIGILIAAIAGFLFIAAAGIYWAYISLRPTSVSVPKTVVTNSVPNSNESNNNSFEVFFGNSNLNKDMVDCGLVFPVKRTVPGDLINAKTALMELLSGPRPDENAKGYFSSINTGVGVNSVKVENNVAFVDFDKKINEKVGGSCRVGAIRSQINSTLMRVPGVKSVVISVDGNTEEALQP